ncbi:M4 family metallopeptidase [Nannocystis sp. ILAH1]|uniref:M4 family metallopeptidase n=1 Tax=unclassified Nannocystis TaxID=2627009 RepID=UPI00226EE352|nr:MULTISPECIES: M4 family metallopeptidase [unclassified Nannocystis]MCY0992458.1 M4 family metallopeptidase [Nannocystis sp. ILAH1]MCY1068951.1 M4 family metallopeptidase [Nannocystis sp. RBIL2]
MSARRIIVSAVSACLLSACQEGGIAVETESRTVTADDVAALGPGEVLEIDLSEGAVRFALTDGPIDFTRVSVRSGDERPALVQDLLLRHGARWGVQTAGAAADFAFELDGEMVQAATSAGGTATFVWSQSQALGRLPRVDRVQADEAGVPRFIAGDLGTLTGGGNVRESARGWLADMAPVFRLGDETDLEAVRHHTDSLGKVHVRFRQYLHDLPVVGGELTVHADAASGQVQAVTGRVVPAEALPLAPTLDPDEAIEAVADRLAAEWASVDVPELVYVVTEAGPRLAWQAVVEYEDEEGPQRDIVFADAVSGEMVARHPQIHHAKNRKVYDANNGTKLPGKLVVSEGGASDDKVVQAANDLSGVVYDFYVSKFGRDSFDAAGATIHSTVHYSKNYVNAFWNGQQMVYGDGDGYYASPFAQDLDVVAHELTHAVTQYEASLVYQNQSGALNEAMSDIMAAAADAFKNGVSAKTWLLAETCWTPGVANDAMRYMANPTQDGQSYDYYPERYTGQQDNGGVHINSGIANLAFYLLSQGGKHPRNKTTTVVPALGIDKAAQIFYRALTNYLNSNATFQDARDATAQAASELYDAEAVAAVHAAWTAVGVPGGPNGDGGGGDGGGQTCSGTPFKGNLSGSGKEQFQPSGSYYSTSKSGAHTGCLAGPAGADFDLYLYKWNGSAWAKVAKSEGPTNNESINYQGTAGYYTWQVVSASGAGDYTVTLKAP